MRKPGPDRLLKPEELFAMRLYYAAKPRITLPEVSFLFDIGLSTVKKYLGGIAKITESNRPAILAQLHDLYETDLERAGGDAIDITELCQRAEQFWRVKIAQLPQRIERLCA